MRGYGYEVGYIWCSIQIHVEYLHLARSRPLCECVCIVHARWSLMASTTVSKTAPTTTKNEQRNSRSRSNKRFYWFNVTIKYSLRWKGVICCNFGGRYVSGFTFFYSRPSTCWRIWRWILHFSALWLFISRFLLGCRWTLSYWFFSIFFCCCWCHCIKLLCKNPSLIKQSLNFYTNIIYKVEHLSRFLFIDTLFALLFFQLFSPHNSFSEQFHVPQCVYSVLRMSIRW